MMKRTFTRKKKKEFEIDIVLEEDFYEKFNREKVSRDLIHYLMEVVDPFDRNERVKIILDNQLKSEKCISMIRDGIKEEYQKCLREKSHNNKIQLVYCLLGFVMLFLSFYVTHDSIFKEIFLISGWVLIWDMIEIEMFSDSQNRRARRVLKKLYHSQIVEKEREES